MGNPQRTGTDAAGGMLGRFAPPGWRPRMISGSCPGRALSWQWLDRANSINGDVDPAFTPVHLSIGCQLDLRCEAATPLLALVHVHSHLVPDLLAPERLRLQPDRTYEVLADPSGNRWCRLVAPAGTTRLHYATTIEVPDHTDPVLPGVPACPIEALPIGTYRFLNASTYCDNRPPDGAGLEHLRADRIRLGAGPGHLRLGARPDPLRLRRLPRAPERQPDRRRRCGVCRDFAHLAITLCRCLNIPAATAPATSATPASPRASPRGFLRLVRGVPRRSLVCL